MVSKNYTIWSAWKGTKSLMFSAKKLSNSQRNIKRKTIFFPLVLSPKLFGLFWSCKSSLLCHVMLLLPYFLPVNALLMQIELGNRKTFSPSSFLSVSQNNSELLLLVFPSSAQLLLVWLQHISLCQDEKVLGKQERSIAEPKVHAIPHPNH